MMRKLIWRGVAVALMTGGVCWTAGQFHQCPGARAARLLRSVMGCTKSADEGACCSAERPPVIVDLSPSWLQDPDALLPEDSLKLKDVLPQERSKELDLIDLSLLSEAAHPARPSYEEEEAAIPLPAGTVGPEAPRVTPGDSESRAGGVPSGVSEGSQSPRYMAYAKESAVPPSHGAVHLEEPPLCQEDPAAPYHYPGCLHTGPCPEPEEQDTPAVPKKDEPSSTPAGDHGADARPAAMTRYHVSLKKPVAGVGAGSPTPSEVDTMEFRPTDAGSVDFLHQKQVY